MSNESLEDRVTRLEAVYASITRIDGKLVSLDGKLDTIIRIEQKQLEHAASLDRAFARIAYLDEKTATIDAAFRARSNVDDGRRQIWNLIYGVLQVVVLGAAVWQFEATQTLKDSVHSLQYKIQDSTR